MSERNIEERAEFPNGIKTEWEPTGKTVTEKQSREVIREMNRAAKATGSFLRYRSVSDE